MSTETAGAPASVPAAVAAVEPVVAKGVASASTVGKAFAADVEKDATGIFGALKTGFTGAFTKGTRMIAITWGLIGFAVAAVLGVHI